MAPKSAALIDGRGVATPSFSLRGTGMTLRRRAAVLVNPVILRRNAS